MSQVYAKSNAVCGGARAGAGMGGLGSMSRWRRILLMTSGSVIQAMILTAPEQSGEAQREMSISKTLAKSLAHEYLLRLAA